MGDEELIARVKAKVREKWTPPFVGEGAMDLGDGPYPGQEAEGQCECCKRDDSLVDLKWRMSRTAYEWDGEGENPNRCLALCDECAIEYNEQMDQQWSDYFSGLL